MSVATLIWSFLFPSYETLIPLSEDEQHWLEDYPTGPVPFRWRGFSAGGYDSSITLAPAGLKLITEQSTFAKAILAATLGGLAVFSPLFALSGGDEAVSFVIGLIPVWLFLFVAFRVVGRLAHRQEFRWLEADVLRHLQARPNL